MSKTFPFCSQVERHLLTHGGSKPWKIKKIFAGFLKVSLGSSSSLKYRGVRMPPQVATEASSQLQTEPKSRKPLRFPSNRSTQAGYHHPAEGSMCLGEKKKKKLPPRPPPASWVISRTHWNTVLPKADDPLGHTAGCLEEHFVEHFRIFWWISVV